MIDRIQIEREARAYVAQGEWEKAISLYRELLDTKGKDPNIYNLIGDVYARMDDLTDAMPEYLTAIDLYEKEGLFENGIAVCKKVIRLDPESGEAYFNLSLFYAEIGLLTEAKDSLTNYAQSTRSKRIIQKEAQRYKKLMMLLSSDERLKPAIKELYIKIEQKENELDVIFGLIPPKPEVKPSETENSNSEVNSQVGSPTPIHPSIIKEVPLGEQKLSEEPKQPPEPENPTPVIEPTVAKTESTVVNPEPTVVKPESTVVPTMSEPEPTVPEPAPTVVEPAPPPPIIKKVPIEEQKLIEEPKVTEPEKPISETKPTTQAKPDSSSQSVTINEKEMEILLHAIDEINSYDNSEVKKEHYELGIKYKNLNFYDAAIREFQLSTASNSHKIKALKELGCCFVEKNEPKLAINAFTRAIEDGGKSSEDYVVVKYEIGKAYELLGDKANAIISFEEVCLHNISYQDAKERLEKLKT